MAGVVNVNKKRVRISEEKPESEKEDNTCCVCDGKDDWVLVCHGEGCLISIHQSCTCDEPDFDEFGNFFCPYCWYKRVVLKSLKLREKLSVGIDKSRVVVDLDVSENVNASQGRRRECDDESYEKFMAMEMDQRREEVAAETPQSQNHVSEDGDEVDLAFNEQEEEEDEQIEHHHRISTDNVQELALVIHQPIEAQPFRTVPPPPTNGTAALHVPEQRKRKRVLWTQAEEEMLKVGVQKFPGVRNIPWRKILEFGRDVFHEDRAPSDLKDKWKNILKMSFEGPRRESGKLPID